MGWRTIDFMNMTRFSTVLNVLILLGSLFWHFCMQKLCHHFSSWIHLPRQEIHLGLDGGLYWRAINGSHYSAQFSNNHPIQREVLQILYRPSSSLLRRLLCCYSSQMPTLTHLDCWFVWSVLLSFKQMMLYWLWCLSYKLVGLHTVVGCDMTDLILAFRFTCTQKSLCV